MANSSQVEQRFNAAVNVIRGLPKNGKSNLSNDTHFTKQNNSFGTYFGVFRLLNTRHPSKICNNRRT